MPSPIGPVVVGVMRSDRTPDALALAARLASLEGTGLLVVSAYPFEPAAGHDGPEHARPEYEALVREDSEQLLEECRAALPDDLEVRTLTAPSFSAARVLTQAAQEVGATAIVVASTRRGSPGRIATGTVADRLLTGSPCSVAVAPQGYAEREWSGFRRIGAAFAPTDAGRSAVTAAGGFARRSGGAVDVIAVAQPSILRRDAWAGRALPEELAAAQHELTEGRARAAAEAIEGAEAHVRVLEGNPVDRLLEASGELDLLVCGSRDYGPASIVLVGGVSKALVRSAACPVVVVARAHSHARVR